jgi:hypothetical protein
LQVDGILPDFALANSPPDASLDYIHRQAGDTDIYFVSNQGNRAEEAQCLFRVRGRQPEIWDPLTGWNRDAVAFSQTIDGRILLPLQFAPRGSLFVVFRKPLLPGQRGTASGNFPNLSPFQEIKGPWKVAFDPKWGGPASVDFPELVDWTRRPEDGIRYYSGKAVYQKTFELPAMALKPGTRLWLDLATRPRSARFTSGCFAASSQVTRLITSGFGRPKAGPGAATSRSNTPTLFGT